MENLEKIGKEVKQTTRILNSMSTKKKNEALIKVAQNIVN